jgi:tRNA(Arg) A34 adenosine deaminase TadA
MKRETNAEKIITGCYVGGYFGSKSDKLRLIDNIIYDIGTPIGKFVEWFDEVKDEYAQLLILTMQDFKSQPSWKTHKKRLAHAANAQGLPVIFVPQIDIGFGVSESIHLLSDDLIKVAKYSQDDDIKTAAVLMAGQEILAYTYNQDLDEGFEHAEAVLCKYIRLLDKNNSEEGLDPIRHYTVFSMLEPCYNCLVKLISHNVDIIHFSHLHKDKWNTEEYIQFTNDIFNKEVRTEYNYPVSYHRNIEAKIEKFYEVKK